MDKKEIKNLIVEYVLDVEGCKATDIITDLPIRQTNHEALIALGNADLSFLVAELVQENRLIEVGYQLPLDVHWTGSSPEEIQEQLKRNERSYLIPAGCEVVIKGDRKN